MARTPKVVEDRRAQIMDAALRVFADKGFVRATNKDIAHAAGITPGLIYHYFASKEALLQAIIERGSPVQVLRALSPPLLALPPATLLRTLLLQMFQIVEGEAFVPLLRVFLPEVIHTPALAPLGLASHQEATRFLETYLATQMARGALRPADPALVAQVLMSNVMGFVLRRQILRDPTALAYTQEQIVDSVVDTAIQGLLPT
jgi:AcrR family transcriptional regulator